MQVVSDKRRRMGRLLNWPLLALSVLYLLASASAYSAGESERGHRLMEKVTAQGVLPVIMRLKADSVPEGLLQAPADVEAQRAHIDAVRQRVVRRLKNEKMARVKQYRHLPLVAGTLDAAGLGKALQDPEVVEIFEDRLSRPMLAESVPLIGGDVAQASGFGGAGQAVAVLDTGVNGTHPFLSGKVVHAACFSSNYAPDSASSLCPGGQETVIGVGAGESCSGVDGCDHGTHVAGIVAGSNASFTGVAPDADILAVQVFSRFDDLQTCGFQAPCVLSYTSDQISALEHVYAQRNNFNIASVNMSLGGGSFSSACDGDPTKAAIDLLRSVGIATVIASGNEGLTSSIGSPACISSAISVGSTTKTDGVSSFSNSAQILDLLAPGSSINSSVPGGSYESFNGTSMATPHVAGVFAALRSKAPTASVDQLLSVLKSTGVGVTDGRNGITRPRVQLDDALNALGQPDQGLLAVAPFDGFAVSGNLGGPFTPSSMTYTLSNNGPQSIDFAVVENETWLDVSPLQGTLAPGADVTVTITINDQADNLAAGTHVSTVSFNNQTNGVGSSGRAVQLTVVPPVAPNDKFVDGLLLEPSSGATAGNNYGAGKENGEPSHAGVDGGRSVWWRWVAPSAGEVTMDTIGSSFDTVLAVYTGADITTLDEVASNDDASGLQSQVSFQTQAGRLYQIAIDGYSGASGDIDLNWNFTPSTTPDTPIEVSPAGDFSAAGPAGGPFSPASVVYTLSNNSASTRSIQIEGLPAWLAATPASGSLAPGNSMTVTLSVDATANALGAGAYTSTVLFNGIARSVSLTVSGATGDNDAFESALTMSGSDTTATGSNVSASKQVGEPDHAGNAGGRSVWWRWIAPKSGSALLDTTGSNFDTLLAVYTGNTLGELTTVAANDDAASGGLLSALEFTAVANTTYWFAVDGYNGVGGAVQLNLSSSGAVAPGNDNFVNAIALSGSTPTTSGSSAGASKEVGEPDHAGESGGRSVWWRWTAPATGTVQVATAGSDFDTLVGVYTGASVGALSEVGSNDDLGASRQSLAVFSASAGTEYFIAVDGYNAESGNISLAISPATPDNDNFSEALQLKGLRDSAAGLNIDATSETGEPDHAGSAGGSSLWWYWTAPSSVEIEFNTIGSDFDTTLAVYTGNQVDGLTLVASNNNLSALDTRSKVVFTATAGTTYRVAVDGSAAARGYARLNLSQDYRVLLVDDDDNQPDVLFYYVNALEALGISYSIYDTGDSTAEPDSATLAPFDVVIWFTGYAFESTTGPLAATETQLQSYLDGGGCLAISSQDYILARGQSSFMSNYLGLGSAVSDIDPPHYFVEGAGPFASLTTTQFVYPFENWSDALTPNATGSLAFIGDQGGAGVYKKTATYRTQFSAFAWEALPLEQRKTVIDATLSYCVDKPDTDGDGVTDDVDNCPLIANGDQANFDHDQFGDSCDLDDDNDGLPDTWELDNGLNPLNQGDAGLDFDDDRAINLEEYQYSTDPNDPDTDNDGTLDGVEIDAGRDPNRNEASLIIPVIQMLLDESL